MTDPVTAILGGMVISFVSAIGGVALGKNGTVKEKTCKERMANSDSLMCKEFTHIKETLNRIEESLVQN